jgi:hypothetical protein
MEDNLVKNKKRHQKQGDNLGLKIIKKRQPSKEQEISSKIRRQPWAKNN